jgi:cation diffusion facilitator CzcD-associated flavoprotein CzcO
VEPHRLQLPDVLGEKRVLCRQERLVVGAGYSAATTVCALARLAESHLTWVVWVARGGGNRRSNGTPTTR